MHPLVNAYAVGSVDLARDGERRVVKCERTGKIRDRSCGENAAEVGGFDLAAQSPAGAGVFVDPEFLRTACTRGAKTFSHGIPSQFGTEFCSRRSGDRLRMRPAGGRFFEDEDGTGIDAVRTVFRRRDESPLFRQEHVGPQSGVGR